MTRPQLSNLRTQQKISTVEQGIVDALLTNGHSVTQQLLIPNVRDGIQFERFPFRADIYLPDANTIVEVDGACWHRNDNEAERLRSLRRDQGIFAMARWCEQEIYLLHLELKLLQSKQIVFENYQSAIHRPLYEETKNEWIRRAVKEIEEHCRSLSGNSANGLKPQSGIGIHIEITC